METRHVVASVRENDYLNVFMKLDIYLNYPGNCEEAFRFYEEFLGAKLGYIAKHGENRQPEWPEEWKDKVLHAQLLIGNTTLMGADIYKSEPMRSAYLSLSIDTEADAERIYSLLLEGGEIFIKMEKTHFANRFAMLRDKFGTSWMLMHQPG